MNRQLRRTRLFGIMALGVLAIVLWQYLLAPRFMTPVEIRQEIENTQANTALLSNELTQWQGHSKNLQTLIDQANELAIILPADANDPELSQQITSAAKTVGARVTFFESGALEPWVDPTAKTTKGTKTDTTNTETDTTKTGTDTKKGDSSVVTTLPVLPLYQMPIRIVADGTINELNAFLNALQSSGRAMTLDQVQISPWNANGTPSSRFQLQITGHAYTVRGIGPAPAVGKVAGTNTTDTSTSGTETTPTGTDSTTP